MALARPPFRVRVAILLVLLSAAAGLLYWRGLSGVAGLGGHHHHHHHGGPPGAMAGKPVAVAGKIPIQLEKVADGFHMPTDLQWVPGQDTWLVLEKGGDIQWLSGDGKTRGHFLHTDVVSESEEGLLGLALHPNFAQNGRFFVNRVVRTGALGLTKDWTQIVEFHAGGPVRQAKPTETRVLLEVEQPYGNHKAGQLQFGPGGLLFVALGDGGAGGDPHGNGQDRAALLGKMLRIDVDHTDPGLPYAVPKDNPFVGQQGTRPEIWALGLRNPWRFSFDGQGRMIVADVGQDAWEEVDIVAGGDNLGWNRREGPACYRKDLDCTGPGMVDPVWSYGHDTGSCITGGYIVTGDAAPHLRGKWVVADFIAGTIWALDLPATATGTAIAWELAQTPRHLATFGRTERGDVWAVDTLSGELFAVHE